MAVIDWLRRVIAAFLTLFIFSAGDVTINAMAAQEADNIRLNVSIISDGHMEGNNKTRFENHGRAFLDISGAQTPVDALVMVGDNTMNGMQIEYMFLYGLMRKHLTVDNVLIAPGNHELCKEDKYEKYYKRFMAYNRAFFDYDNEHAYFSREINGYKLIVMATEKDSKVEAYHSPEQLDWLKNELADAAASGKPAFVFNHNPLEGKFEHKWPEGNVGPQGEELDSILKSCGTEVFYFSGHLHMGIYENGNGLAQEDNVTYINVPGFGEECNYGDLVDAGMGWQMEVYDTKVVLRLRNFVKSEWVEGYEYTYEL
ncbi:MAG TPA: metallophosphoesterase [Candidatus Onthovicinus excrementipullorum]|mgnify:FL=1|nr:metallophosphoesterase [Candidatus Onthovicinus excrementipullorum]